MSKASKQQGIYKVITAMMLICFISCQLQKSEDISQEVTKQLPKLFLLSKGLVNDTLKTEFLDLVDADPSLQRVAVVVNATGTQNKKLKKTRKVKERFAGMGFDSSKIEMFDLLKRDNKDLFEFDIIYILGGNPYNLLSEVRRSNADTILIELASMGKILMGYSAGALLLGPNLELMDFTDPILGFNGIQLTELSCLDLYDFLIFPHFDDFTSQVPELKKLISDFEDGSELEVIRLNDDQGIIIEEGKRRVIGQPLPSQ